MAQNSPKLLTFDDFIARYGDNERYELVDGQLIDIQPTGPHEEVVAFILRKVNVEIDRLNIRWFTPARCLIRPLGTTTAFRPDACGRSDNSEIVKPRPPYCCAIA